VNFDFANARGDRHANQSLEGPRFLDVGPDTAMDLISKTIKMEVELSSGLIELAALGTRSVDRPFILGK